MRETMTLVAKQVPADSLSWKGRIAVAVAIAPFIVKRVILLGQHDYIFWLAADYSARMLSLVGVAMARQCGIFVSARPPAGVVFSVLIFIAVLIAQYILGYLYPILHAHLYYFQLASFPPILNPHLRDFDLTFGLLLTALSEEYVFRALLFAVFERWHMKPLAIIILSSVAFALIHVTSGVADAINALLYGLLWGAAYWVTGRLSVCVAAHYLADLIIFGQ
jgi:membrane protease YdiL (CAAX protease family)